MKKRIFFCLLFLTYTNILFAGITTNFFVVDFNNLKIGQIYSSKELANFPYKIFNQGEEKVRVRLDIQVPEKEDIPESRQKLGYEPIPDVSWIHLEKDEFIIAGGENAESDVIIGVPADEKYLDKKYMATIWCHTVPLDEQSGGVYVGIYSHLYFTISPYPPTKEELEEFCKLPAAVPFKVNPKEIIIEKIIPKQNYQGEIEIVNPGLQEYSYEIFLCNPQDIELPLKEGYQDLPDFNFLKFSRNLVKVSGESSQKINFVVNISDEKYADSNFMTVIVVQLIQTKAPITIYVPVYLHCFANGSQ